MHRRRAWMEAQVRERREREEREARKREEKAWWSKRENRLIAVTAIGLWIVAAVQLGQAVMR